MKRGLLRKYATKHSNLPKVEIYRKDDVKPPPSPLPPSSCPEKKIKKETKKNWNPTYFRFFVPRKSREREGVKNIAIVSDLNIDEYDLHKPLRKNEVIDFGFFSY